MRIGRARAHVLRGATLRPQKRSHLHIHLLDPGRIHCHVLQRPLTRHQRTLRRHGLDLLMVHSPLRLSTHRLRHHSNELP